MKKPKSDHYQKKRARKAERRTTKKKGRKSDGRKRSQNGSKRPRRPCPFPQGTGISRSSDANYARTLFEKFKTQGDGIDTRRFVLDSLVETQMIKDGVDTIRPTKEQTIAVALANDRVNAGSGRPVFTPSTSSLIVPSNVQRITRHCSCCAQKIDEERHVEIRESGRTLLFCSAPSCDEIAGKVAHALTCLIEAGKREQKDVELLSIGIAGGSGPRNSLDQALADFQAVDAIYHETDAIDAEQTERDRILDENDRRRKIDKDNGVRS